jgi:hypothetical protein
VGDNKLFFNPDITSDMTKTLAQRAWFSMNVAEHDDTGMDGVNGSEWRLAGEGVGTINEAIKILLYGTRSSLFPVLKPTIALDYGAVGEQLLPVGVENLRRLRCEYVKIYGWRNKPDVYDENGQEIYIPPDPPLPPPCPIHPHSPPTPPPSVSAIGNGTVINVSWGTVPHVHAYNVYRGGTSGQQAVPPYGINVRVNEFTDYNVQPSVPYFYTVKSVKKGLLSDPSNEAPATR